MTHISTFIKGIFLMIIAAFYGGSLGVLLTYENKLWASLLWISLMLSGCFFIQLFIPVKKSH